MCIGEDSESRSSECIESSLKSNFIPCYTRITDSIILNTQIRAVEFRYYIYICTSVARDATLGVLYSYKIFLQAVTVVMALRTRKVKVRGLDDYREIIMATYLTSFVLVIILIVNYTLKERINAFAAVTSLSYFTGATAIMVLVFVPKVSLY